MEFIKKFSSIFQTKESVYVNAATILSEYKRTKGNSHIKTIADMIESLQISKYIIVGRRGKNTGNIINNITIANGYNSATMSVFIDINLIKSNNALVERIRDLPDVRTDTDPIDSDSTDTTEDELDFGIFNQPILQLEEHELFRDAEGEIFDIKVRGTYGINTMYFKAKDIEGYFEIDQLVKRMLRTDQESQYKLGSDYVHRQIPNRVSTVQSGVNHYYVYLTVNGLLQVIFTTKSGNKNKDMMRDWVVNLAYKHKFGTKIERIELAKELTQNFYKHMLNKNISGLYYIEIGCLNDLYDSMQISRETYPPNIFGKYRLVKYGRANNLPSRSKDHQNEKNGYGRWSNNIEHKWSIMVSESQLSGAEKTLKTMLKAENFQFEYTDPFGADHIELILVKPSDEPKVKKIYSDLLKLYPSKENELAQENLQLIERYDGQIAKLTLEYEKKLHIAETKSLEAEHRCELLEATSALKMQDLSYKNEILELKLAYASK